MEYEYLRAESDGAGVIRLTLNRPEVRNALHAGLIRELTDAVERAGSQPGARCMVLAGEGPVFCAGGDVRWLRAGGAAPEAENLREIQALVGLLKALNELRIPVIASVRGAAIGGGVGLVSVADVAVCSADTVFSLSEARLGLAPSCIAPFLIAKIGLSWTRRYMIGGDRFDAEAARRIGLVHEVALSPARLAEAVEAAIQSVLASAPEAVSATKRMIHGFGWPEARAELRAWEEQAAEVFARSRSAPEAREGLAAIVEKRAPNWRPAEPS